MPIHLAVRANYIHVHWSGIIDASDLKRLFKELPAVAAGCAFIPHILHTADPAAVLELGAIEAFNYTRKRIATPIPVRTKAAFVATTPAGVAVARNFINFNRNPNLTLQSFVTEKAAVEWLSIPYDHAAAQ
jgi:hypothetical protein